MRYTAFPFGMSVSPHYFCAAISEVHRLLRQHPLFKGAPVINLPSCEGRDPAKPTVYQVTPRGLPTCAVAIYVDDAMVTAPTYGSCQRALGVISRIFMRLGLREKRSKRDPPSRRCLFLGIEMDSSNGSVAVRIPPSKLALIRAKIAVAVGAASETSAINRRLLPVSSTGCRLVVVATSAARLDSAPSHPGRAYFSLPRRTCVCARTGILSTTAFFNLLAEVLHVGC
jgi:hypothetical protein